MARILTTEEIDELLEISDTEEESYFEIQKENIKEIKEINTFFQKSLLKTLELLLGQNPIIVKENMDRVILKDYVLIQINLNGHILKINVPKESLYITYALMMGEEVENNKKVLSYDIDAFKEIIDNTFRDLRDLLTLNKKDIDFEILSVDTIGNKNSFINSDNSFIYHVLMDDYKISFILQSN